jgi:hypothetical protein
MREVKAMTADDKPVHSLCVDKISCRHEVTLDKDGNMAKNKEYADTPTAHLTKDYIRKQYKEGRK